MWKLTDFTVSNTGEAGDWVAKTWLIGKAVLRATVKNKYWFKK